MASKPVNQFATGVMAELYKAAIGPRGQDYYLRHFSKFDADGKTGATWHWPAYWSTLNWLIYRRMWGWALTYVAALLGLVLVIFGIGKLVFNYSDSTGLLLFLLFLTAAFVLPGLYANAWYYNYCSEKISAALRNTPEDKNACDVLAGQASTKRRWFGLAAANVAVLALGASGATFILNFGQEGGFLAQTKKADQAASELTGALQPVLAAASVVVRPEPLPAAPASHNMPGKIEELAVKTAEKTSEKAAGKTEEKTPEHTAVKVAEPVQVAAANTGKPASTTGPDKTGTAASDADTQAKPVRTGADAKPQAKAVDAKHQWFVQVGAFAREANAQNVRTRIEATGLPSSAEPSDTPAGRLIRVRVGPFDSKAEAGKAALQIKALDLPAVLVRQ